MYIRKAQESYYWSIDELERLKEQLYLLEAKASSPKRAHLSEEPVNIGGAPRDVLADNVASIIDTKEKIDRITKRISKLEKEINKTNRQRNRQT